MKIKELRINKEITVEISKIKKVCTEKLNLVKHYLLDVEDIQLKKDNQKLFSNMLARTEDLFQQISDSIDYLKETDLLEVLDSILERFELVDLINADHDDRCEEYFEVLLDLPTTVTNILKLDVFNNIKLNQIEYKKHNFLISYDTKLKFNKTPFDITKNIQTTKYRHTSPYNTKTNNNVIQHNNTYGSKLECS